MDDFSERMRTAREACRERAEFRALQESRVHACLPGCRVEIDVEAKTLSIFRGDRQYDDWGVSFDQLQSLSEEFRTKDINLRNSETCGGGSWTGPGTSSTWIEVRVESWEP